LVLVLGWVLANGTLLGQGQTTPFVERHILGCQVILYANPPPGLSSYAVIERPPFGNPAGINEGGLFDPATGLITFGPFSGGEARSLSYSDAPPDGASGHFAVVGEAVADGSSVAIVGDGYVDLAAFPPPSLRLLLRLRPLSHQTVVQLEGDRNAIYQLQASTNLADWMNVGVVPTPEGIGEWLDPEPAPNTCRFYRAGLILAPAQLFGSWDYHGYDSAGQLIATGFLTFTTTMPSFSGTWEFHSVQSPRQTAHYEGQGAFTEVTLVGSAMTIDLTPRGMIDNSFRLVGQIDGGMVGQTIFWNYTGQWHWDGEGPSQSGAFTAQWKP
jgi:hypothetical protein